MTFVERRRFLWILFLAGLFLIALVARATTFAPLRLENLARQAVAIARLRCLSVESRWEQDEIWTEARFEVVETEKGLLADVITVRTLGGRAGHLESHVDGSPRFRPGEEVYLFLWRQAGESYGVLGWAQGTFRIERNPRSGRESVIQDLAGGGVFDPKTRTFRRQGIFRSPVELFRERIRKSLDQGSAR